MTIIAYKHIYSAMFESLFSRKGLTLEKLRRFCEVADAGSIAQAQKTNNREQPSYSRDVIGLEDFFGSPLFGREPGRSRSGKRLKGLTPQGQALFSLARDFLHRIDDLREYSEKPRRIRIGGGEMIMQWVVGAHLDGIRKQVQGATVDVTNIAEPEDALAGLQRGELDFAVVDESVVGAAHFPVAALPLGALSFSLFIHRDEPERSRRRARKHLLAKLPWVTLRDAQKGAVNAMQELEETGIAVRLAATLSTFRQVTAALKGKQLAAFMPVVAKKDMESMGFSEYAHGDLKSIAIPISLLHNMDQVIFKPYLPVIADALGQVLVQLDTEGRSRA